MHMGSDASPCLFDMNKLFSAGNYPKLPVWGTLREVHLILREMVESSHLRHQTMIMNKPKCSHTTAVTNDDHTHHVSSLYRDGKTQCYTSVYFSETSVKIFMGILMHILEGKSIIIFHSEI